MSCEVAFQNPSLHHPSLQKSHLVYKLYLTPQVRYIPQIFTVTLPTFNIGLIFIALEIAIATANYTAQ